MSPEVEGLPYAAAVGGSSTGRVRVNNADTDDDQLLTALEQILQAETNRRIMASSPSAYMQGGNANGGGSGPLTKEELRILSLLCTEMAGKQARKPPPGSKKRGFASVEGDLLTALMELLEKHVNLAVGVDLIQEAVNVIQLRSTKIDQVSDI